MDYVQLKSGVIVSEAEFAEIAGSRRPSGEEIAGIGGGRDITRGYVDALPILPPTDTVLQSRGGGDYKLYEDLLRDDQVKTCLAQRKLALVSKEWKVEPATSGRRDKKAADALKAVLDRLAWDEMSQKMLAGIFYGHSVAEILWGTDGAETTIEAIKVRKQRRFGFSPQGELKLITSANAMGEVMPDRKFWTFATGADDDDEPYGLGLAHWLYWPVFFKRNGIKFWLTFLEKFAAPTVVGKYPSTATPGEKDALLQAAAAVQRDAAIRIPESMQIELIEAARSGTVDYVALCDRMDNAIAKVILGHTASTQSTPGKWGAEHLAQDVREDIIKADADLICGSFNLQVARWFTEYNDPQANPPRVWRDCEAQEDLKARADRDKVIFDMGFKPTAKYITDTYSGEWEEKTAPPPNVGAQPNGAPAEGQPAPAFAEHHCPHCYGEGDPPDALDALRDLAQDGWQPVMQPITHPLVAALDASIAAGKTLAQFQAELPALLGNMDISKLTESLAQAGFMARAAGDAGMDINT